MRLKKLLLILLIISTMFGLTGCVGDPLITNSTTTPLNWLGNFAVAPASPVIGDAYHNTTNGNTYYYQGGWQIIAASGADGAPGTNGADGAAGPNIVTTGTTDTNLASGALASSDGTHIQAATSINLPTGRTATYVIAASDATATEKAQADVVCDGTSDQVQFQDAIDAITVAAGGNYWSYRPKILGIGTFHFDSQLVLAKDNVELDIGSQGYILSTVTDGSTVLVKGISPSYQNIKVNLNIEASGGTAISSATGIGLELTNISYCDIQAYVFDYQGGVGIQFNNATTGGYGAVSSNNFKVTVAACKYEIQCVGTANSAQNHFENLATELYTAANSTCIDVSTFTGYATGWTIPSWTVVLDASATQYGINGSHFISSLVGKATINGQGSYGNGFVLFNNCGSTVTSESVDLIGTHASLLITNGVYPRVGQLASNGTIVGDQYRHMQDFLINNSLITFPFNSTSMTDGSAGDGASGTRLDGCYARTSATDAAETGHCYSASPLAMNMDEWYGYLKNITVAFDMKIDAPSATTNGYIQFKSATTAGELAGRGFGIRIDNQTLYGEAYQDSLVSVDLGTTLTGSNDYLTHIAIVVTGASRIDWYVNGVLKGTTVDATKIPQGGYAPTLSVTAIKSGGSNNFYVMMYGLNFISNSY